MDFAGTTDLAVACVPVFGYVQDLATYPSWFTIVDRATPTAPAGDAAAWEVDLAARLGPLKRTKRVRMIRSEIDVAERHVRFERRELDGASHGAWVLDAVVEERAAGCRLHMTLHYSGISWLPGIDLLLREEAKRAGHRLEQVLQGHGHRPV